MPRRVQRDISSKGRCYDRNLDIMGCSSPTFSSMGCSVEYLSGFGSSLLIVSLYGMDSPSA
jgi:hypothetical protein